MSDISHAGITVSDLERSVWFYGELLGMDVARRYTSNVDMARPMWKAPGLERLENVVVQFPQSEQQLQLTQADGDFGPRRQRLDSAPWDLGAAHLSVVVDDLDTRLERFSEHGFLPRSGPPMRVTAGSSIEGIVGAYLDDPDGFGLELIQRSQASERSVTGDVAHAGIVVSDLDESIWFYRDVLGMEALARGDEDATFRSALWGAPRIDRVETVVLRKPGLVQVVKLLQLTGIDQQQIISKQWDVGFAHVCVAVDGFDAMVDNLATRGIEPRASARDTPAWAVGGHVADPDGFDLEVLQLT